MMGWELAYADLNSRLSCGMRNFGKIESVDFSLKSIFIKLVLHPENP